MTSPKPPLTTGCSGSIPGVDRIVQHAAKPGRWAGRNAFQKGVIRTAFDEPRICFKMSANG